MEYKKMGDSIYIRMDKDDEMIDCIMNVCRSEGVGSATYVGIGGCKDAEIQTFIPEKGDFRTDKYEGMLELVSFIGNVISDDDGELYHHTHVAYSYFKDGEHGMIAGHLKSSTVLYTAEIELRPVKGGVIGRKLSPETGTGLWKF